MTDPSAHVELRDYESTVPKAYIGLAWLWVGILWTRVPSISKIRALYFMCCSIGFSIYCKKRAARMGRNQDTESVLVFYRGSFNKQCYYAACSSFL